MITDVAVRPIHSQVFRQVICPLDPQCSCWNRTFISKKKKPGLSQSSPRCWTRGKRQRQTPFCAAAMNPTTSEMLRGLGVSPESYPRLASMAWHRVSTLSDEALTSLGVVDESTRFDFTIVCESSLVFYHLYLLLSLSRDTFGAFLSAGVWCAPIMCTFVVMPAVM